MNGKIATAAVSALMLISLISVFQAGTVSASPEEETIVLNNPTTWGANARGATESYIGSGSWANDGEKMELYLPPEFLFGENITINDIAEISYHTLKYDAQGGLNFYINIYTMPYTGGDSTWYGNRLTFEPMYSHNFNDVLGGWNTWTTNDGTNQLTVFDSNNAPYGWYYPPILDNIQAGPINWRDWTTSGENIDIDYTIQIVKYVVIATGNPWCATFEGYVDALTIKLKDGASVTVDLEPGVINQNTNVGYNTIQEAIDAAGEGDTVLVYPGTYEEGVVIDKPLTLRGENRETTEIKFGYGAYPSSSPLTISADGVTVSGFTIRSGPYIEPSWTIVVEGNSAILTDLKVVKEPLKLANDTPRIGGAAVIVGTPIGGSGVGGVDGFTFTDSIVESAWNGIYAPRNPGSSNIVVRNVDFTYPGEYAILLMMSTNSTIEGNTFTCTADKYGVTVTRGSDNIEIVNNQFVGSGSQEDSHVGILLQAYAEGTMGDVDILRNDISGFKNGILVEDVVTSGISINYNNIVGNLEYGVQNIGSNVVDATLNWWGDPSGPSGVGPGTGDAVSANVDYTPWFATENPSEDVKNVELVRAGETVAWSETIQAAIDAASPGDTVIVGPGIYEEEVKIMDKSLTLLGAQADVPIVNGERAGDESIIRGKVDWRERPSTYCLVRIQHSDVVINGFTIEGAKQWNIGIQGSSIRREGISDILVSYIYIKNSGKDGIFRDTAAADVTITHNYIASNSRGIATNGGSTTITNNTFYGNGKGIDFWGGDPYDRYFPDYAEPKYPTIISGNTFTNDSTSITLRLDKCHQSMTITGNDITEARSAAIKTWNTYGENIVNPAIHHNNIWNNEFGINNQVEDINLDATLNWWGSENGPSTSLNTFNIGQQGDNVSANVDFTPWLDAAYPDGKPFAPVVNENTGDNFSSIQAAIDNAMPGETVLVGPGTYKEHIVIDKSNLSLIGEDKETTIIDATQDPSWAVAKPGILIGEYPLVDGVQGVTVSGFTIRDAAMQEGGVPFEGDKYGVGPGGLAGIQIYNSDNNIIENNILINNYWQIWLVAEWPAAGYTTCKNNRIANNVIRNSQNDGVYLYSDGGVFVEGTEIINNEIDNAYGDYASGVEFWGWPEGGSTPTIAGTVIRNNDITNCTYGVRIREDVSDITGTSVNYNNFVNNTNYGVYNGVASTIDATYNYWGHPSGPRRDGGNPNCKAGRGDRVSENVLYRPWLTKPFQTVLEKHVGHYGFEGRYLEKGWNTLSVPIYLDNNAWEEIAACLDENIAYRFNASTQAWELMTTDSKLDPLDAIYIRMNSENIVPLVVSVSITNPPVKELKRGWNLIGLAVWEEENMSVDRALVSVELTPDGNRGYTIVVSSSLNQEYWAYTIGQTKKQLMHKNEGYWVYMENPGNLAGFSTTPLPFWEPE